MPGPIKPSHNPTTRPMAAMRNRASLPVCFTAACNPRFGRRHVYQPTLTTANSTSGVKCCRGRKWVSCAPVHDPIAAATSSGHASPQSTLMVRR